MLSEEGSTSLSSEDKKFAAALKLIHDAVIAKELKRRPPQLSLSHG